MKKSRVKLYVLKYRIFVIIILKRLGGINLKEAIINYQKAFNKIIEQLSINKEVVAVFTFGSIVSGDIWEESDIDLFVVYKNQFDKIRHFHSEVLNIPVHMKVLSKASFLKSNFEEGKNGVAQKILAKSKLVLSNDLEITDLYNNSKYIFNSSLEEENLIYLGELLKEIGVCKKYLKNDRLYTSFEVLIKALDKFSKLYLSLNGYRETKDAINMVVNLEDSFAECMVLLLYKKVTSNEILEVVNYVEKYVNKNILKAATPILRILRKSKSFLSSSEVKEAIKENGEKVKVQFILNELYKIGVINKDLKEVKDEKGNIIINEVVYGLG